MAVAVRAGLLYFALVFLVGFIMGTARTLVLQPKFGEATAIWMEVPFMVAVSVVAARFVVHRMAVPAQLGSRLMMGLIAFAFLMLAELFLGTLLAGSGPGITLAAMVSPARLPGFLMQLLFAALPSVLLARR